MILSISRRTDIPAFFPEWFINRVREGYLCVRNPMNHHQVSKIPISPELVDCMVFWTKDVSPMLPCLEALSLYPYYFQYTVTGYGKDLEPDVPDKALILSSFQELSERIGSRRVIWRYDPILFTDRYTPEVHIRAFRQIAEALQGYTEKCVISFVDIYAKNTRKMTALGKRDLPEMELKGFASVLAEISHENGMEIATCAEEMDLSDAGIGHNCCIDKKLIEEITGVALKVKKDPSQRKECGCAESIDVGTYNTCCHGCLYCYASWSQESVRKNLTRYDPASPMLCDSIGENDKVYERKVKSLAMRD